MSGLSDFLNFSSQNGPAVGEPLQTWVYNRIMQWSWQTNALHKARTVRWDSRNNWNLLKTFSNTTKFLSRSMCWITRSKIGIYSLCSATQQLLRFLALCKFEQRLGTLSEFCEQDIYFHIFRGYSVQPRLIKNKFEFWTGQQPFIVILTFFEFWVQNVRYVASNVASCFKEA